MEAPLARKEPATLVIRIGVAFLVGAPFAVLLGWTLAGEAYPSIVKNTDLRAFYDRTFPEDWLLLNIGRGFVFLMLSIGLTSYILRVRTRVWSIATGVCLVAAVALYFWGITSYKTAETRLALHPYLGKGGLIGTTEDVSFLMGPLVIAMAVIFVLGVFFDSTAREVAELEAIAPAGRTATIDGSDDAVPGPEGLRG